MEELASVEEVCNLVNIDTGGTPSRILEGGKAISLLNRGLRLEQLLIILDPFDLSRAERGFTLSNSGTIKRIKFPISASSDEKMSSDRVCPPEKREAIRGFLEHRERILAAFYSKYNIPKSEYRGISTKYESFVQEIGKLADSCNNLRGFMEGLIRVLLPSPITLKHLESVLSENIEQFDRLLFSRNIAARVFCPGCGRVYSTVFNPQRLNDGICCSNMNTIAQQGLYIPSGDMLTVLLFLSGINPCLSRSSPYIKKALSTLKDLNALDRPLLVSSAQHNKTMFESYLLGGINK